MTAPDAPGRTTPLLALAEPIAQRALATVDAGARHLVDAAHAAGRSAPFDPARAVALLAPILAERLGTRLLRTTILELHVARLRGQLRGDTAEARFADYCAQLRDPATRGALFAEYPVLEHGLAQAADAWASAALEFLARLDADQHALGQLLGAPADALVAVEGGGDPHRGGRCVLVATFASGARAVYKPRPLAVDVRYAELVARLNALGLTPTLRATRGLDRGAYGWSEFVDHAPCRDAAELDTYYERFGATVALLHTLHATDLHFENLIASGPDPVVVDLEALLHPIVGPPQLPQALDHPPQAPAAPRAAAQALATSVLRTGLLPTRAFGAGDFAGAEVSAVGGEAGQLASHRALVVVDEGRDTMRVQRGAIPLTAGRNRPHLASGDRPAGPLAYVDAIDRGFTACYRLLAQHAPAIAAPGGWLDAFADAPTRAVLRATHTYCTLLFESTHPSFQRAPADRDRFLDQLGRANPPGSPLHQILPAELADLQRGDVPFFSTRPDTTTAYASDGAPIDGLFPESGLALARRRILALSEADLRRQRWILRASFVSLPGAPAGHTPTPTRADVAQAPTQSTRAAQDRHSAPATRTTLLAASRAIAAEVSAQAIAALDTGAGPEWLGVATGPGGAWNVEPTGDGLYEGRAGIALYLAHHGHLAGDPEATHLARTVAAAVARHLRLLDEDAVAEAASRGAQLGGGFGPVAGTAHALLGCATLWRDPALVRDATRALALLSPTVAADNHLDVIAGAAGTLLVAASAFETAPAPELLDLVRRAADRLHHTARPVDDGAAWDGHVPATRPLTGFSHGASGIGVALLRAAALLGRPQDAALALRAFDYERRQFTWLARTPAPVGNWPDYRILDTHQPPGPGDAPHHMLAWCHGAPGVGLARAFALGATHHPRASSRPPVPATGPAAAAITTDLTRALDAVRRLPDGDATHCLCHGSLGNIELLLVAARLPGRAALHDDARRVAAGVIREAAVHGWRCGVPLGVPTSGLLTGLSGIGYALLRLAAPKRVPSILLLEPPAPAHVPAPPPSLRQTRTVRRPAHHRPTAHPRRAGATP